MIEDVSSFVKVVAGASDTGEETLLIAAIPVLEDDDIAIITELYPGGLVCDASSGDELLLLGALLEMLLPLIDIVPRRYEEVLLIAGIAALEEADMLIAGELEGELVCDATRGGVLLLLEEALLVPSISVLG